MIVDEHYQHAVGEVKRLAVTLQRRLISYSVTSILIEQIVPCMCALITFQLSKETAIDYVCTLRVGVQVESMIVYKIITKHAQVYRG